MEFKSNLYDLLIGVYFLSLCTVAYNANSTKEYSSYVRYPLCTPSEDMRYPTSAAAVAVIVKEAVGKNLTVKAFGIRHSQTDIICTEGIPIDMRGVQFLQMNSDNTATFGAGVSLREATEFLRENGRGLRTTPAYGNITLGGAIGTGAHGSTIKYNASISSQVIKLTIVNGKGDIQKITDPEDLKAFKLNLGLLGIVVDVTLYTVALYKTHAHNYIVPDDVLTNGVAINWAKTTDQIALYWFPAFEEVVVANWTIVDVNTPGSAYTNDHVPSTYANLALVADLTKEIAFSLTESTCGLANSIGYTILHALEFYLQSSLLVDTPDWVPIYTENGYTVKNPAVGYYDLMFAPTCNDDPKGILGTACVWAHGANSLTILDNEFSLDLKDLIHFITVVKDILSKTPVAFPLQGILMRFSNETDVYMSTAYGRQTVHFEFYLWNRKDIYNHPSAGLAGFQTILQTLAIQFTARSHWGKSGMVYHNSPSLDMKLDPVARRNFVAAMNKFDPNEVFINNFGRRLKSTGTKVDIDPLTTRCALLDNCFCTRNSDCGDTQICTSLPGYTFNVCKTKNEVPDFSFNKQTNRSLGLVGYCAGNVPTLVSAALAECAIDDALGTVSNLVDGLKGVEGPLNSLLGGLLGGTTSEKSSVTTIGTPSGTTGGMLDLLLGGLG